jgi:hypothetical protein
LLDVALLDGPLYAEGNAWDLVKALVNLTVPSKSSEMIIPDTFYFDKERLIEL